MQAAAAGGGAGGGGPQGPSQCGGCGGAPEPAAGLGWHEGPPQAGVLIPFAAAFCETESEQAETRHNLVNFTIVRAEPRCMFYRTLYLHSIEYAQVVCWGGGLSIVQFALCPLERDPTDLNVVSHNAVVAFRSSCHSAAAVKSSLLFV